MEVFRISDSAFSKKLIASGLASRWNVNDQHVLYTSSSRSLATLELLVNQSFINSHIDYRVMVIAISDDTNLFTTITEKSLPKNWRSIKQYNHLQNIGSNWYINNRSLVLKVPSAVIPKEFNYVINTRHPDFKDQNIRLDFLERYFFDERLLS